MTNSGKEQRNADWQNELAEISLNYTTRRKIEIQDLESLHLQTKGPLIPFLFNSKYDNEVLITNGIANNDGILKGKPKFRLFKTYQNSLGTSYSKHYKRIFKPQLGTVEIYNNDILQSYTIDYENGTVELPVISSKEITAITKATNAVITCPSHGFTNGTKLYLNNITGMTEINNMVVNIINVIDSNNFSVNINTLSYSTFTYTALTSFAEKYINGTENITWKGKFYLPVRFKEDVLSINYDNFDSLSCAVTLTEIRLDEVNEYELDD